jgi:hypothetical protein
MTVRRHKPVPPACCGGMILAAGQGKMAVAARSGGRVFCSLHP